MTQRAVRPEAKRSGSSAVVVGGHRTRPSASRPSAPPVVRMPPHYAARDVEVILAALWRMFTDSQARKIVVAAPWDDSDDPSPLTVADVAAVLASWLEAPERG